MKIIKYKINKIINNNYILMKLIFDMFLIKYWFLEIRIIIN